MPLGGFCRAEPNSAQGYRIKNAVFTLGGPGVELLMMGAAALVYLACWGWEDSPYLSLLLLFEARRIGPKTKLYRVA